MSITPAGAQTLTQNPGLVAKVRLQGDEHTTDSLTEMAAALWSVAHTPLARKSAVSQAASRQWHSAFTSQALWQRQCVCDRITCGAAKADSPSGDGEVRG